MRHVFVLRVSPGQGDYSGFDGDAVAVVEMTPALARTIQQRIGMVRALKRKDPQVLDLYFWDHDARWYEDLDPEKGPLTEAHLEAIQEKEWDAFETDMFDGEPRAYTEVEQMVVTNEEVRWTCMPKHSEVYAVTGAISLKEVEKFIPKPKGGKVP